MTNLQSKRSEEFKFRLSKSEKTALKSKALQANLSLGSYLIKVGLQQTIRQNNTVPQINRTFYAELGEIKNDINFVISAIDNVDESKKLDIQHSLQTIEKHVENIQLQLLNCCS